MTDHIIWHYELHYISCDWNPWIELLSNCKMLYMSIEIYPLKTIYSDMMLRLYILIKVTWKYTFICQMQHSIDYTYNNINEYTYLHIPTKYKIHYTVNNPCSWMPLSNKQHNEACTSYIEFASSTICIQQCYLTGVPF